MLKRLHLRHFTVFEDADFEFGPGLNVLVGANGTGKSHVLKVGYARLHSLFTATESNKKTPPDTQIEVGRWAAAFLHFITFLERIFQSTIESKALIRHGVRPIVSKIETTVISYGEDFYDVLSLSSDPQKESNSYDSKPKNSTKEFVDPVFIPAKEVLTLGWLLPLYARREIPIDETYPDLLRLLMGPPLRQPAPSHIVEKLQKLLGGKVEEEGGYFYLTTEAQPRMEMNLVAEGLRKFATLYKLLANGTLTPDTTLFWDEPEANLNPALLRDMAAVLAELARAGFQIILATHSLFLMKELHILAQREPMPIRYFGLSAENGGPTQVAMAEKLTALPNLVALDVEMAQSDIFLDVLNQEEDDNA